MQELNEVGEFSAISKPLLTIELFLTLSNQHRPSKYEMDEIEVNCFIIISSTNNKCHLIQHLICRSRV